MNRMKFNVVEVLLKQNYEKLGRNIVQINDKQVGYVFYKNCKIPDKKLLDSVLEGCTIEMKR